MFEAPAIIKSIPDIAKIYEINDRQSSDLDAALDALDANIFIDTMDADMTSKWERILDLYPAAGDALSDRRARVKLKILERLPYSYRVIVSKVEAMCRELYDLQLDDARTELSVIARFDTLRQSEIMEEMLERCLPLNMIFGIFDHHEKRLCCTAFVGGAVAEVAKTRRIGTAAIPTREISGAAYAGVGIASHRARRVEGI